MSFSLGHDGPRRGFDSCRRFASVRAAAVLHRVPIAQDELKDEGSPLSDMHGYEPRCATAFGFAIHRWIPAASGSEKLDVQRPGAIISSIRSGTERQTSKSNFLANQQSEASSPADPPPSGFSDVAVPTYIRHSVVDHICGKWRAQQDCVKEQLVGADGPAKLSPGSLRLI